MKSYMTKLWFILAIALACCLSGYVAYKLLSPNQSSGTEQSVPPSESGAKVEISLKKINAKGIPQSYINQ